MAVDAVTQALIEDLVEQAKLVRFGRMVVELTIRQGHIEAWEITEQRPRRTRQDVLTRLKVIE